MNIYSLPENQVVLLGLVFLRIVSFIVSSAIFGTTNIPTNLKILLSLLLTFITYASLTAKGQIPVISMDSLILSALKELGVGLSLGFLTRIFFLTISMGGDFISISLGLGSAQLFNPAMGNTGNVVEQLYTLLGMLLFLALNGHHLMISALVTSFDSVKVGTLSFGYTIFRDLTLILADLLKITIQIAAPILVTALIINVAMAILGRVVPQINVQVTTAPITILVGLGIVLISLPVLVNLMTHSIDFSLVKLFQLLKSI